MLSKNEQIILYILLVAVILGVGIFVFLLPNYRQIETNENILKSKQAELQELNDKYSDANFAELEARKNKAEADGKAVAATFHEEIINTYEVDRMLRAMLTDTAYLDNPDRKINVNLDNLTLTALNTYTMTLSVFRPQNIEYAIKEYSRIGAVQEIADAINNPEDQETVSLEEVQELVDDALVAMMSFLTEEQAVAYYEENKNNLSPAQMQGMREALAGASETVAVTTVMFEVDMTPKQFDAFSVAVFNQELNTSITSFEITEVKQEEDTNTPSGGSDDEEDEGEPAPTPSRPNNAPSNIYETAKRYTITVTYYCVAPISQG